MLAVYEHKHGDSDNGTFTLAEQHLYGAGRLGMRKRDLALNATNANETPATYYELTNHLGNVMAVISDEASTTDEPTVVSLSDYYPYGMTVPGRNWNSGDYRFSYTGHEKEEDLASGVYTTEYRLLDTRLGRWLSVDPMFDKYPNESSYNYCGGNSVLMIDPKGKDRYIFKSNGDFDHKETTDGRHVGVLLGDENRENICFEFADPVSDPKQIDEGIINHVEFVSEEKIQSLLKQSDAFNFYPLTIGDETDGDVNTIPGPIGTVIFFFESMGGGDFDYSYNVLPNEYPGDNFDPQTQNAEWLYLPEGDYTTHNHMNFGNYLWGATGYLVGFSYAACQLGAHFNSLVNPGRNGYESQLDSPDDQKSIKKGIFHAQSHKYRKIKNED